MIDEALKEVCVLGAAGKMGRGISLLLLQEMARLEAEKQGSVGEGGYRLILVDPNKEGLDSLKSYLRMHITRFAESHINSLRKFFTSHMSLVSNEEVIRYFVTGALDLLHCSTHPLKIQGPALVFEAVVEDLDAKAALFKKVKGEDDIFFLSNTSSIPIHILDEHAQLHHQIVGFHFYNPPSVQKLVELVIPEQTDSRLQEIAKELVVRLKKTVVFSCDVAGFIGNGYFMREILYACEMVRELSRTHSLVESIYIVNEATQNFLIRPMGIFQLVDYVGLDVVKRICSIMSTYIPDEIFEDALLDGLFADGILGGQTLTGSQKDGFFQYQGYSKKGIYSLQDHQYVPINEEWKNLLGDLPQGHLSWKEMEKATDRTSKLQFYFENLNSCHSEGAELAIEFFLKSREIARLLVDQGVAQKIEDVDQVLQNGFFHLYGPNAGWLKLEVGPRS
jgi:3-hydroxyacyl-CoA dehydrogenase